MHHTSSWSEHCAQSLTKSPMYPMLFLDNGQIQKSSIGINTRALYPPNACDEPRSSLEEQNSSQPSFSGGRWSELWFDLIRSDPEREKEHRMQGCGQITRRKGNWQWMGGSKEAQSSSSWIQIARNRQKLFTSNVSIRPESGFIQSGHIPLPNYEHLWHRFHNNKTTIIW